MKKFLTTCRSLGNSENLREQAQNPLPQKHMALYMALLYVSGSRPDEVRTLDISELNLKSK